MNNEYCKICEVKRPCILSVYGRKCPNFKPPKWFKDKEKHLKSIINKDDLQYWLHKYSGDTIL